MIADYSVNSCHSFCGKDTYLAIQLHIVLSRASGVLITPPGLQKQIPQCGPGVATVSITVQLLLCTSVLRECTLHLVVGSWGLLSRLSLVIRGQRLVCDVMDRKGKWCLEGVVSLLWEEDREI